MEETIITLNGKTYTAQEWVEQGMPCVYRHGYGFKGARTNKITTEKANELFPRYTFGKGFYVLSWLHTKDDNGNPIVELLFNELSENDMY